MNQLFQELGQTKTPIPQNIKNMVQMVKGFNNPEAMLKTAMNSNPKLKSIVDASNGNYETAFRTLAKDMGVDAEEIIEMLK